MTESADLSIYLPKVDGMLNTLTNISVTIDVEDDVAESDETGNNARIMVCYGIFCSQPQ